MKLILILTLLIIINTLSVKKKYFKSFNPDKLLNNIVTAQYNRFQSAYIMSNESAYLNLTKPNTDYVISISNNSFVYNFTERTPESYKFRLVPKKYMNEFYIELSCYTGQCVEHELRQCLNVYKIMFIACVTQENIFAYLFDKKIHIRKGCYLYKQIYEYDYCISSSYKKIDIKFRVNSDNLKMKVLNWSISIFNKYESVSRCSSFCGF